MPIFIDVIGKTVRILDTEKSWISKHLMIQEGKRSTCFAMYSSIKLIFASASAAFCSAVCACGCGSCWVFWVCLEAIDVKIIGRCDGGRGRLLITYYTRHHAMLPSLLWLSSWHAHHGTLLAGQYFKGQKYRLVALGQKLSDWGRGPVHKVRLGKIKVKSDRGPNTVLCQLD